MNSMKKYSLIYNINAPGGGVGINRFGINTLAVNGYQSIGENHIKDLDQEGDGMGHACIMACVNNIPIFNLGVTMKTYPGLYKELFSSKHYNRYQDAFKKEDPDNMKPTVKLWSYMKEKYPNMISFSTRPGNNTWHTRSGSNTIQIIRNESLLDHRWVGKRYFKENNQNSVTRAWIPCNTKIFPATESNKVIYKDQIWNNIKTTDPERIPKRLWKNNEKENCQASVEGVKKFLEYDLWEPNNGNSTDQTLTWKDNSSWYNEVRGFSLYTDLKYNANLIIKDNGKGTKYEGKRYGRSWVVREHIFSIATSRLASMMMAEKFERLGFFLKFHESVCSELKQKKQKLKLNKENKNNTKYTKKLSEFGDIGLSTSDYACQGFTQSALVSSGINDKFIDSKRPNWGLTNRDTKRLRVNFYTGISDLNLDYHDIPSLCFKVITQKQIKIDNDGSFFVKAKIQYFDSVKRLKDYNGNNKIIYELSLNFSIKKETIQAFIDIKNSPDVGANDFSGLIDHLDDKYWSEQVAELSNKGIGYLIGIAAIDHIGEGAGQELHGLYGLPIDNDQSEEGGYGAVLTFIPKDNRVFGIFVEEKDLTGVESEEIDTPVGKNTIYNPSQYSGIKDINILLNNFANKLAKVPKNFVLGGKNKSVPLFDEGKMRIELVNIKNELSNNDCFTRSLFNHYHLPEDSAEYIKDSLIMLHLTKYILSYKLILISKESRHNTELSTSFKKKMSKGLTLDNLLDPNIENFVTCQEYGSIRSTLLKNHTSYQTNKTDFDALIHVNFLISRIISHSNINNESKLDQFHTIFYYLCFCRDSTINSRLLNILWQAVEKDIDIKKLEIDFRERLTNFKYASYNNTENKSFFGGFSSKQKIKAILNIVMCTTESYSNRDKLCDDIDFKVIENGRLKNEIASFARENNFNNSKELLRFLGLFRY